jgi:ATP-dependent helicase/nuclease subunit A
MLFARPCCGSGIEAHVDPDFQEMDQGKARKLFTDVFRWWMERQLNKPTPVMSRALARLSWMDDFRGPLRELEEAAWQLVEWRNHQAPWEKRFVDREAGVGSLLVKAQAMLAMWPAGESEWARSVLKEIVGRLNTAQAAGVSDLDQSESELLSIPKRLKKAQLNARTEPGRAWRELMHDVKQYAVQADADLASHLHDELWRVAEEYEEAKTQTGQLDFTDLLLKTRNLLRNESANMDLRARYDRVFVDEFQDTDPLQAEILKSLAPPNRLFLVGDPKQSIYRFRHAEPRVYGDTRAWMCEGGAAVRLLTVSYRSTDAIQEFVNAAFADMEGYSRLEGGPAAWPGQPSIVALPVPKPYEWEQIQSSAILECTPSAVGAFIEWLISKSGWSVRQGDTRRKVQPEDICILFRRMTNNRRDLSQDYVRSLEARGIDHTLVGSKGLHQREEAAIVRTALHAIEWPDDELSVYAVLRGPLFGIDDGMLLKFREQHGRLAVFGEDSGEDSELEPIWDALHILRELHRERNHKPVADTIRRLLAAVRGHAIFAFHGGGVRRLANLHRIAELARQSEAGGSISFRAFVQWLQEEAESGETAEAPVLEQQAGGVRLMTVHKAKGLEFPVVILADPSAGLTGADGSNRWVDSTRGLCA